MDSYAQSRRSDDNASDARQQLALLEALSKKQAASITELQTRVAGLTDQVAALFALVSPHNELRSPATSEALAAPSHSLGSSHDDFEVKVDDLAGALPSEDPGSPTFLRAVLKDREDSKDSKATLNSIEDHSRVDSELRPSTPDPLDLPPFSEAPYVYAGEEGTVVRRQSLPLADAGVVIKRELGDEMTVSRTRPAKRARFDGVFIPPRVPTLEDYMHARLRDVPAHPVILNSAITDVRVPRQFLSTHFGGSNRSMFVALSAENRRKHGHSYPHFLFSKADKNYTVPRTPGEPGLMFLAQWEKLWAEGPQKLLVGLQHSQWRYMGEYNLVRSERMSSAEFNALPGRVQEEWGRILARIDGPHSWRQGRAHIVLSKQLGRAPSAQELDNALDTKDQPYEIDPQEITQAFKSGVCRMHTWRMECVGYDEDFQRRIAERFPSWTAETKPKKQKQARVAVVDT